MQIGRTTSAHAYGALNGPFCFADRLTISQERRLTKLDRRNNTSEHSACLQRCGASLVIYRHSDELGRLNLDQLNLSGADLKICPPPSRQLYYFDIDSGPYRNRRRYLATVNGYRQRAWIYRCDDTTRPGIARQRIISDKDDIADLQCFAATVRLPPVFVTRADIPEASGSRTYLLAVERRCARLFKSDSLKVPAAQSAGTAKRNDLALMIQVLLDLCYVCQRSVIYCILDFGE
ncbi:hypothetical protein EVAR_69161_1 [Eumeta japonica]|uniref:Uncharacterized protein n=1 Tax=Eumeta variegata TaxID=151549 RepID=A0A4C1ZH77_EUMVA|nr:hypothetical protein EVAR_69161_1 [Eumeta japonica]